MTGALAGTATAAPRTTAAPGVTAGQAPGGVPGLAGFRRLEERYGARLGVLATELGSGRTVGHRTGERFAVCSTFKTYAVAGLLREHPLASGWFERRVPVRAADIVKNSPVTEAAVGGTLSVRELCDAAVRQSDNTATNLLLRLQGGPGAVISLARAIGDPATRIDHWEPHLGDNEPDDPRDTTTPAALAHGYRALVLGSALRAPERRQLRDWLVRSTTGDTLLRAGLPDTWTTGDKSGAGSSYGRRNDVAVSWTPTGTPLLITALSDKQDRDATHDDALLADTARLVARALRPRE
ncbi:class A beta-lactamase [Streptomyces sp. HNM0574]|uniref:class A beta-lactamase n=1 Tax=Streptomyces sp. HNM0574 TaxID=2714954 RepID=UPI0019D151CC